MAQPRAAAAADAASLFGADSDDPFASIGGGGGDGGEATSSHGAGKAVPATTQQQPSSSSTATAPASAHDLFQTGSGGGGGGGGGTADHNDWLNGGGGGHDGADPSASSYDWSQQTGTAAAAGTDASNSYYDGQAQYDYGNTNGYYDYSQQQAYGQYGDQSAAAGYDAQSYAGYDDQQQQGQYASYGQYDPQQQYGSHYDASTAQQQQYYGDQSAQQQHDQYGQQYGSQGYDQQYDQQQYGQQYGDGQQQYDPQQQQYDAQQQQYGQYDQQYSDGQQYDTQYGQQYGQYDAQNTQYAQYDAQNPEQQQQQQQQYAQDYSHPSQDYSHPTHPSQDYSHPTHPSQYDAYHPTASAASGAPLTAPRAASPYDPQTASVYEPSNYSANGDYSYDGDGGGGASGGMSPVPATSSLPPPPPKGPSQGPPKGPPRGPPRSSSRSPGLAASSPTTTNNRPASPSPQLRSQSQSLDDQPAPWDVPAPAVDDGATSPDTARPTTTTLSTSSPPVVHRQPTPRLTVTDEEGLEARPADLDSVSSSAGDADGEGAAIDDDDVDEATRDFNELQLGLSQKRGSASSKSSGSSSSSKKKAAAVKETEPVAEAQEDDDEHDAWFGNESGGQGVADADADAASAFDAIGGGGDTTADAAAAAGGAQKEAQAHAGAADPPTDPIADADAASDDPWFANEGEDGEVTTADASTPAAHPPPSQRRYGHAHAISSISQADDAWFADDHSQSGDDGGGAAADDVAAAADVDPDATIPASTDAFGEYHDDDEEDEEGLQRSRADLPANATDAYDGAAVADDAGVGSAVVEGAAAKGEGEGEGDVEAGGGISGGDTAVGALDSAAGTAPGYATSYDPRPDAPDGAPAYDPYAPSGGDAQAPAAPPSAYNPYAPQDLQGQGAGSTDSSASASASAYDPYAPQGGQGQHVESSPNAYDPYAPQGGQQSQDATSAYDPYAPQGGQSQEVTSSYNPYAPDDTAASSGGYDPYAPQGDRSADTAAAASGGYNPYAPAPADVSNHTQNAPSSSSSNGYDYNAYAPSQHATDPYGGGEDAGMAGDDTITNNAYGQSSSDYGYGGVGGAGYGGEGGAGYGGEDGGAGYGGENGAGYGASGYGAAGYGEDAAGYSASGYGAEGYDPEGGANEQQQQQRDGQSYDSYAPRSDADPCAPPNGQQHADPYAPRSDGQHADPYAPSDQQPHSRGAWGLDADPYGPAPTAHDEMDVLATPVAPHPPQGGLASPFAPAPAANGLSRGKTITQRSFTQPGVYQPREEDYFARPGSAASGMYAGSSAGGAAGGGLASPYDAAAARQFTPTPSDKLYHAQAADPIEERRGATIPVVTFALDGKMAAFFPLQQRDTDVAGPYGGGGDIAQPTKVVVRQLSSLVPPTSFASSFDPLLFPGPAFEGAGNPSGAIARATGTTGVPAAVKTKKTALIKYLRDAASEMDAGMGYRKRRASIVDHNARPSVNGESGGDVPADDAQKTEDRILLLRLLALVLEHDGNTSKNAAFDEAVRQLLTSEGSADGGASSTTFAPASLPTSASREQDTTLVTTEVTASALKQIQEYLMTGQRKEAVDFAVRNKLWAHAMVIASAVDQATWRKVAQDFAQDEVLSALQQRGPSSSSVGNIAGLKMMYDVFSGQDPSHIYHLFKPAANNDVGGGGGEDDKWRQSAAMVIANRCAGDSAALTAMGDGLLSQGRQEAAHVCYLLSPQTSPVGGADGPNVRLTLLGAHNPLASTSYVRDLDHFILSEVYEFSHALVPTAKGQEQFPGLAHLQAYRLVHAYRLAELGETKRAQKYCEAIASVMKASKNSTYFHRVLVTQLKELSDRLVGGPQLDSGGNWVTRKMQRPTLDGMLSAFEGRFTKFIAGDDSSANSSPTMSAKGVLSAGVGGGPGAASTPLASSGKSAGSVGAFSHYSSITPDAGSASISRVQSYADFSSSGTSSNSRPSSAMGGYQPGRGRQSPMPPAGAQQYAEWDGSAAPYAAGSNMPSYASSQAASESATYGSHVQSYGQTDNVPWPGAERDHAGGGGGDGEEDGGENNGNVPDTPQADVPQWGYDADSAGPQGGFRPQFFSTGEDAGGGANDDPEGFLSPMDTFTPGGSSTPSYAPSHRYDGGGGGGGGHDADDDDDDDLGFGNSSSSAKKSGGNAGAAGPSATEQEAERKRQQEQADKAKQSSAASSPGKAPELKSSPSTSWLGRLWGRRDSSDSGAGGGGSAGAEGKAKQAHMGEQSSFYYDKELKRWVNKKAGDTGGAAATPPPPPRATTASPSMASRSVSGPPGSQPMLNRSSTDAAPTTAAGLRSASATYSYRGTPPPISENHALDTSSTSASAPASALPSPPMGSGPLGGSGGGGPPAPPGVTRARSNLGDPNQPAAVQPPTMRPGSAGGVGVGSGAPPGLSPAGPPPPRAGSSASKKKPISKRYVRVD